MAFPSSFGGDRLSAPKDDRDTPSMGAGAGRVNGRTEGPPALGGIDVSPCIPQNSRFNPIVGSSPIEELNSCCWVRWSQKTPLTFSRPYTFCRSR
jgi:hypothetical protein